LGAWLSLLPAVALAASPVTPTFLARRDYTGLLANWVQVADANGDGIPDLIASFGGDIQVLFGNGDGTFGPASAPISQCTRNAWAFAAVDLTGSGTVDIVVAGGLTGTDPPQGIGVCLGNGDGTFQPVVFYEAGSDVGFEDLAIGDFNGDGILDAATAGAQGVWLFTGKGDGTFSQGVLTIPLQGGNAQLAAADFNGDGNLDLVVTEPLAGTDGAGNGFIVALGNGNGTFQTPIAFSEPTRPLGIAVGSLTKGGPPSVALSASGSSDVYLYTGNGAGSFSSPRLVYLPSAGGVALGDVNDDGIPDLIANNGYIDFGTPDGRFKPPVYYPVEDVENSFSNVVLADLTKNGFPDIITSDYYGISVLLNEGKGKFEDGETTPVTGGARCGAAADYNGDGKPDLAVVNAQGITILLGTGEAATPFTTGATIALKNAGRLITTDLNGDGIPDLLVPANGTVVAYLGNGNGTFSLASTTATPSGGHLVAADFNHDGIMDFATSGNLLALGNGDGTFQTPVPIVSNPPDGGFSNIATGDINNDGWPDLVLTNLGPSASTYVYVLVNNHDGGFTQVPTTFGAGTIQAILADLNGDGDLDLVLQSSEGGARVYLGNGTGSFTPQVSLPGPVGGGGVVVVADLNGDGIPDIAEQQGDTIGIYLGEAGATYAPEFEVGAGPSPGDMLVENLHGQSPSKGIPDLVLPDTSRGVVVLINKTR
jgi:hypothetical protein